MARVVQIRWCYPMPFDDFSSHRQSNEMGFYQIARRWGGKPGLAYIGIVWSDTRTFADRMQEHRRDWIDATRGQFELRFGELETWDGVRVNRQLIEEVEGVLICNHQPPFNRQKRSSFSIRRDLVVKNVGNRGFLDTQIDTATEFDWL